MNPQYLCDMALMASCVLAVVSSSLRAKTIWRACATGILVACPFALLLTPLLLAVEMLSFGKWENPDHAWATLWGLGGLMGLFTAALAVPAGAGSGLAGLWLGAAVRGRLAQGPGVRPDPRQT